MPYIPRSGESAEFQWPSQSHDQLQATSDLQAVTEKPGQISNEPWQPPGKRGRKNVYAGRTCIHKIQGICPSRDQRARL